MFESNALSVGNTPMVQLKRLGASCQANVYAKLEGRNFSYSIKGRCAISLLDDAEKQSQLVPGVRILEATSGNTGIALAFSCAAREMPLSLVVPDCVSEERKKLLEFFGAELIFTCGNDGVHGAVEKARELAKSRKYL